MLIGKIVLISIYKTSNMYWNNSSENMYFHKVAFSMVAGDSNYVFQISLKTAYITTWYILIIPEKTLPRKTKISVDIYIHVYIWIIYNYVQEYSQYWLTHQYSQYLKFNYRTAWQTC